MALKSSATDAMNHPFISSLRTYMRNDAADGSDLPRHRVGGSSLQREHRDDGRDQDVQHTAELGEAPVHDAVRAVVVHSSA
ncbi:hypothetical protein GCM10025773_17620 [Microbacterium jejuense]